MNEPENSVPTGPWQPAQAKALGLPSTKGALIAEVRADSPAAKAGVQAGDVIVKLNGEDVPDHRSLRNQAAGRQSLAQSGFVCSDQAALATRCSSGAPGQRFV